MFQDERTVVDRTPRRPLFTQFSEVRARYDSGPRHLSLSNQLTEEIRLNQGPDAIRSFGMHDSDDALPYRQAIAIRIAKCRKGRRSTPLYDVSAHFLARRNTPTIHVLTFRSDSKNPQTAAAIICNSIRPEPGSM